MGKKVKFTGSRLLGRELRRLRGTRTLDEISALTSSPPLSHHVTPVATPTLCQAETGTALPSLPTLYTLSVVYRVSMNQLMGYVVEERLASRGDLPTSDARLKELFREHLIAGRWFEALPLAIHGERSAETESSAVTWRANRASCLQKFGLHQESAWLFMDCVESGLLNERQLHALYMNLASLHASAGWWRAAFDALGRATALTSAAEAEERTRSTAAHAGILIEARACGVGDASDLRAALRLLDEAEASWPPTDAVGRGRLALYRAVAHHELGNDLVASRDLAFLAESAGNAGNLTLQAHALVQLGIIRHEQGKLLDADRYLQKAEALLEPTSPPDLKFTVFFSLYKLASRTRPSYADAYLKHCDEVFPLLATRSRLVREYEAARRGKQ